MKNTILYVLLIGTLCQFGFAQSFDSEKLDSYFDSLEAHNKFMGSVAVSKDGEIIYSKSIGFCDIENGAKADKNSKYRIGSISKTFTSVLVLKAVEENKLDLNQTISKYFPKIENSKKITIKNLLNHRSGIHNFTNDEDYLTWNTEAKTEKEMIKIITKSGSDFEPGSKAEYSNSNFVLLSYILEKTYNKSYAELLQMNIIEPLALKSTYFGGKTKPNENECKSYKYRGSWIVESETDMSIPLGAGGIVSTPTDLTRFSDALFGGKLLNKESLELMKNIEEGYGIGLFKIPFYDKIGYGHTGGIDAFSSVFSYFSDGNVSFALTSNGANYNTNKISIAVLSAVFGYTYEIPTFNDYSITSEELDKYLGVYTSTDIDLEITVTKEGNTLIAQGTGQPALPLEATEKDKFKFDQAGAVFEFSPEDNKMVLVQGGARLTFTKE